MATRIEDYALLGDCETAALVNNNGSIDWLCWPSFSSEACFCALLGTEENGYWRIFPANNSTNSVRRYRDHTLILETVFENDEGAIKLIDFMPIREHYSDVVRIVEGIRGKVSLRMELVLRFDYGRTIPWVTSLSDGVRAVAGPNLVMFHSSVPARGEDLKTVADFTIEARQRAWFTLTYGASYEAEPPPIDADQAEKDAEDFWCKWSSRLAYQGQYRDIVERSLITLKAMTYRPTGGLVAAMTTSLPEHIGGVRNWDYRYCWLRDTTLCLTALAKAGYYEEATAWQDWLLRALAGSPDQVQIMYGLKGERQLVEWEVDWLPGYENSKPVRVGNAASTQLQLDIYGETLNCFYRAQQSLASHGEEEFRVLALLLEHLEKIWQEPDEGIWETRGEPKQFTYSKMMAWVAFDRAIKLAEELKYRAPVSRWKSIRDTIHEQICREAYNREKKTFVQSYGSDQLDAALLLMPLVGFLPAEDPRVRATIEAIERELMVDGFVRRYDTAKVDDGLPPGEGAFLACSFWMVSSLHAIGRAEDARRLFQHLVSLSNDVGLLSEEYDPKSKRLLGNFPQAFSHIALIYAAFQLEKIGRDGSPLADTSS
ncbi:MAG: glycoside hydrolase family 15 protein [Terracidiphilus sp.]|jgi:GH15 family glucan-1,4-alpha-glucosidase